jgi:ferredoxin-type protein NapH
MHEGKCREVCLVPHVLDMTKLGYGKDTDHAIGPDCTRCAMCLDVCPTGALTFNVKGLSKPAANRRVKAPEGREEKGA